MSNVFRDREILAAAQSKGAFATLGAYLRLSGPGWLQSAVTLGGGSLAGALYLGMAGGYSLLWVQLVAIICGVVMLSAISYVTLSTGKRPYAAMNEYINPVLGTAWVTATILANMIWILPQFSLAYDALETNLLPGVVDGSRNSQLIVSGVMLALALGVVLLSLKPGWMAKLFDALLKLIIACVVICFVAAVVQLFLQNKISWDVFNGFIPDLANWGKPSPTIAELMVSEEVSGASRSFWESQIVGFKQEKMIASLATAVGINMTFLLPYSMLSRGWDKTFRGLARWDLITGMAIPFVIVTSCIVITTAYGFHGKADSQMLSADPAEIAQSGFYGTVAGYVEKRLTQDGQAESLNQFQVDFDPQAQRSQAEQETLDAKIADAAAAKKVYISGLIAEMPADERKIALALAKPTGGQLAKSLEPLLGAERANLVFGIGTLGMAFSTIIILMLINGFALGEILNDYNSPFWRFVGAALAGGVGFCWVFLWGGASKTYLAIVASTFGILLLPIAYFAFLLMMNNRDLLGDEKPVGFRMTIWNVLMVLSLGIVSFFAYTSLIKKLADPGTGQMVLGGVLTFGLLMLIGFSAKQTRVNT
jgi:Mn2+/Fe2+ NRAMP family transporter